MHGARRVAHLRPRLETEGDVALLERVGGDAEQSGDADAWAVLAEQRPQLLEPVQRRIEAHLGAFHIAHISGPPGSRRSWCDTSKPSDR